MQILERNRFSQAVSRFWNLNVGEWTKRFTVETETKNQVCRLKCPKILEQ